MHPANWERCSRSRPATVSSSAVSSRTELASLRTSRGWRQQHEHVVELAVRTAWRRWAEYRQYGSAPSAVEPRYVGRAVRPAAGSASSAGTGGRKRGRRSGRLYSVNQTEGGSRSSCRPARRPENSRRGYRIGGIRLLSSVNQQERTLPWRPLRHRTRTYANSSND
jgi:hypothetical protein